MTYTQGDLNQICRDLLGDTNALDYTFTQQQINGWINLALADLSIHFPRIIQYDITTVDSQQNYELPAGLIGVISVEYPQGEDPPIFLLRRSYTHPAFYMQDGYYDLLIRQDQDTSYPPELIISARPIDDETIRVEYKGPHTALSDPGDECTLLDRHVNLIPLFVRWKAHQELSTSEGRDPDAILHIMSDVEINATRAEAAYRSSLQEALKAESESRIVSTWKMDRNDRIY
jgi:hypothetical protein